MADLEKYTLDFVKKISSLMQQGDWAGYIASMQSVHNQYCVLCTVY